MLAGLAVVLALTAADPAPADAPVEPPARTRKSRTSVDDGNSAPAAASVTPAGAASTPQGRQLGVGIQLGYPTAVTLKYMLQADQGIVAGLGGFSGFAYDVGAFSLTADYVYHPHLLTSSDVFALTWYVGGGGNVIIFGNPRQHPAIRGYAYFYYPTTVWLAARMPIGVNVALKQQPFETYIEATPGLLLFPELSFGIGVAIGARFYF